MSNNNNPPFRIGQEVVAIRDSSPGFLYKYKKGDVKRVAELRYSALSGEWDFRPDEQTDFYLACQNFHPLHRYPDLTAELAAEACKDRVEVDVVRELVTEKN